MSQWGKQICRIARLPAIGLRRTIHSFLRVHHRRLDWQRNTYVDEEFDFISELGRFISKVPLQPLTCAIEQIDSLSALYVAHYFDLLGSGWVKVKHGMCCRGMTGHLYECPAKVDRDQCGKWIEACISPGNQAEARRIWSDIHQPYVPIDWQLDFKSGYRWDEKSWFQDIRWGKHPGADIKVPWELARMQHLIALSWAYGLASQGFQLRHHASLYLREFRNQILDFIAANPPRFGVNWHCPMDIAIRAVNWLVAYDVICSFGAEFDTEFKNIFRASLYAHGRHVISFIEWSPQFRNNHYLANLAGLIFLAGYLPSGDETDTWLSFALTELIKEVKLQFHPEGSNFEGSTCYHRLSAEMVAFATALTMAIPIDRVEKLRAISLSPRNGIPRANAASITSYPTAEDGSNTPFPTWYVDRVARMADFIRTLSDPSGHMPQIGDNDNGRFLKILPPYLKLSVKEAKRRFENLEGYSALPDEEVYWWEDQLDHRSSIHAIQKLTGGLQLDGLESPEHTDALYIACLGGRLLAGHATLSSQRSPAPAELDKESQIQHSISEDFVSRETYVIPIGPEPASGDIVTATAFPQFGIFIWQSQRFHLVVRCGPVGQRGIGGHDHYDQLSLCASILGRTTISDPGTFCYSACPEIREDYRSLARHWAPRVVSDVYARGAIAQLFSLPDSQPGRLIHCGNTRFDSIQRRNNSEVRRTIRIEATRIVIEDFADSPLVRLPDPTVSNLGPTSSGFSPSYGWRYKKST